MVCKDSHLSDQDLLLAADGELPARRQSEVRRHLQACWTCRRRMAEMEGTIADFVDCYHSILDSELSPKNGSDAMLRARLLKESSISVKREWVVWAHVPHWRWSAGAAFIFLLAASTGIYLRHERTMFSNLTAAVPNPSLTPGEAVTASKSDVCQVNTLGENGDVPEALRDAVFIEYGMKNVPRNAYEVDFLITPALGGAASIRNLWPEPYRVSSWNAHTKDALERRLHTLVCNGDLDLATAQREIATNWVAAYKKYVQTDNPM
jgi:hypothetical protein